MIKFNGRLRSWQRLSQQQKNALKLGALSIVLGFSVLFYVFKPQYYRGPCQAAELRLPRPDYHPSALQKRRAFYQKFPLSQTQKQIKAPYFDNPEALEEFWQCDQASRREVFIAAYYSLAYFPRKMKLKATAVQLMAWSQEPLIALEQLEQEVLTQLFSGAFELKDVSLTARIALNLMKKYNQSGNYSDSLSLYEDVLGYFKAHPDLNPGDGFQQLLLLELAQSQWQLKNPQAALKSLEQGLSQYRSGGWNQRLQVQAERWRPTISP